MTKLTREELMKSTTMTCGKCGGTLHVIPVEKDGKITTINICKCTFGKTNNTNN